MFLFACSLAFAQITTTVNPTITQLQQALQGNGVTVTGVQLTCPVDGYALFGNGAAALGGLTSGILLTTGTANSVAGMSTIDLNTSTGVGSSALGDQLAGDQTYDGCYISFLITPTCNTLSVNYVFASEEYPEFVNLANDAFGFVISGPNPSGGSYSNTNISLIPGTSTPVTINNVNNGTTNTGPCVNCAYYVDSPPGLAYDARTTVLTASTAVTPCQTYTMIIGVWDAFDGQWDSGVFLDVNGLSCAASPTLVATATPSLICPGSSVTLSASGGIPSGTYTWTAPPSGGLTTTVGQTVTANPTANTTYTLLYSDMNTCPGIPLTEVTTVSITAGVAVTVAQTPAGSICAGQSVTLTATGGGGTYSWAPSTGLSTTSGSVTVASPAVTTTYTVTNVAGSCTNTAVRTVTVVTPGAFNVTPTNTTICSGQPATLNTTGGGPTYTWTASSGANPAGTGTVTVNPTTTTNYTVVTGAGTCTASATATVTVAAPINLTVTPTATTICAGGSTGITAAGATSYSWSPATALNTTSGPNVTASPTTTTIYTVQASNGTCTVTGTSTVTVSSLSLTAMQSSTMYCGAVTVTLSASGATSYTWAPPLGLSSTSGGTVTATPPATTVYTVTGSTGSCVSSKTLSITVPPTTTVGVTASTPSICAGSSSTLTATGAVTYSWIPSTGLSATTGSVVVASPATTTTYTVGGLTAAGCVVYPSTITVNVNPAVTPTISASSTSICVGSTLALTANPTAAGYSYTWSPASALLGATNGQTATARPTNASVVVYSVIISDGQCQGTGSFTLSPFNCVPPTAGFTTSTQDSICAGGCVTFSNTSVSTGTPTTYSWGFPGGTPPTSTAQNPQVCYDLPGDYPVWLVTTNPYGKDSVYVNDYINVAATPTVIAWHDTTINIGQSAPLTVTGGLTYHWSPSSGLACSTCSNTTATPSVTTHYIVTAYNSPYCKSTDTVHVIVEYVCGDFFVPNAFSPNGDGLNDYINIHGFCVSTFNLQIFNRWGEKVFETNTKEVSWDGTFRNKPLDTGVFVYKADGITIEGKAFSIKGNITLIR